MTKVNGHEVKPYTVWHLKNGIVAIVTEIRDGSHWDIISGIVHVHAFMDSDQPVGIGKFHWTIDGKDNTAGSDDDDDWSLDRPVLCGEAKYLGMAEMLIDPPPRT